MPTHLDHAGWCSTGCADRDQLYGPCTAIGPNIQKGYTIQSEITLLDTAPTIASIRGIPAHHEWKRRSVEEIFQ
jgi:hypothetical protein